MSDGADAASRLAASAAVGVDDGLSDDEFARLEATFGFAFADDHRSFLAAGLPAGPGWPNWRASPKSLARTLRLPVEGIVFAVEWSQFWDHRWGPRPAQDRHAVRSADHHLRGVPQMVPLHAHHYLPPGPGGGHPVLSIYQADIRVVGSSLSDWVDRFIRGEDGTAPPPATPTVAFWSDHVR